MTEIIKTKTGTLVVAGTEYNKYPPPPKLLRVMKRCWADELINKGIFRFGNLEQYRKWENEILGDINDGHGMYKMNDHEYNTGSINSVYALCTSLPEISQQRINQIAKSNGYDCIVEINNPAQFINRITNYLTTTHKGDLHLHCGKIRYDRGNDVDKKTLNSQQFHHNVFQKNAVFSEDFEYRLSLTNCTFNEEFGDVVNVEIGNCSDIVKIKNLIEAENV